MVAVDGYSRPECSRNNGTWVAVSFKAIGQPDSDTKAQDPDPDIGGSEHVGSVGRDIAFSQGLRADGSVEFTQDQDVQIRFEASGGVFVRDAFERFFEIQAYDDNGKPMGVARHLRIAPSGSVRYLIYSEFRQ